MITANVIDWTEAGNADQFEDEHGFIWLAAYDAIDGTIAVERADGSRAGVFTWDGGENSGDIAYASDGDTYGVNCTDEFVAKGGEWTINGQQIVNAYGERIMRRPER